MFKMDRKRAVSLEKKKSIYSIEEDSSKVTVQDPELVQMCSLFLRAIEDGYTQIAIDCIRLDQRYKFGALQELKDSVKSKLFSQCLVGKNNDPAIVNKKSIRRIEQFDDLIRKKV